ncbi:MAG: DNA mismatch repair endonuclease MutL [Deltaproteobacteria bacterium]|nr:DNA mismatch repair endonuclease MutL [Deltaproteobacteria bacterium]
MSVRPSVARVDGDPPDPPRRVRVLPEALANQIAAGEVVERPASVVKELVENAIDAGAARITVEITEAGRGLVRVVDDGEGMSPEDAVVAVQRHATSKLATVEDLAAIATLGFRGEALPSIASVSRFTLITRRESDEVGTRVSVEGGAEPEVSPVAAPVGTTVEVRDLFWNVPARLKFLKSNGTEAGHVSQLVTTFALGHPHLHVRYVSEGKLALDFPAARRLGDRVVQALGKAARTELHEVAFDGVVQVAGFVSAPQLARGSPSHITVFVNGRRVRDRTVQHAIVSAYGNELGPGRFPQAVLYVHLDPHQVDVNVHPAKAEVRFQNPSLVHESVAHAVRATLVKRPWQAPTPLPLEIAAAPGAPGPASPPQVPEASARPTPPLLAAASAVAEVPTFAHRTELRFEPPRAPWPAAPTAPAAPATADPRGDAQVGAPTAPSRQGIVLGQLRAGLVVVEDASGDLLIVDPEVAERARVRSEIVAQAAAGRLATQPLLMPVALELSARGARAVEARRADLAHLGLWVEPFGGRTFQVLGMPGPMVRAPVGRVLDDVARLLEREPRADTAALLEAIVRAAAPPRGARLDAAQLGRLAAPDASAIVKRLSHRELGG